VFQVRRAYGRRFETDKYTSYNHCESYALPSTHRLLHSPGQSHCSFHVPVAPTSNSRATGTCEFRALRPRQLQFPLGVFDFLCQKLSFGFDSGVLPDGRVVPGAPRDVQVFVAFSNARVIRFDLNHQHVETEINAKQRVSLVSQRVCCTGDWVRVIGPDTVRLRCVCTKYQYRT